MELRSEYRTSGTDVIMLFGGDDPLAPGLKSNEPDEDEDEELEDLDEDDDDFDADEDDEDLLDDDDEE